MDDRERQRQIDEIVASGRTARPRPSRALWIVALAVGLVCIAAFAVILVVEPGAPATTPVRARGGGGGFAAGIAVGLVAGVAIGYAVARRRS